LARIAPILTEISLDAAQTGGLPMCLKQSKRLADLRSAKRNLRINPALHKAKTDIFHFSENMLSA
jgi:hypothetical protein